MEYFFITLIVFGLFILMASIGYILQKKTLQGSCGGMNTLLGKTGLNCMICGKKTIDCEKKTKVSATAKTRPK